MATSTAIKFYKKAYTPAEGGVSGAKALSLSNAGGIYFDQTYGEIWVGGYAYGGGAIRDVNYTGTTLTITKSNGTTQTLDFSDVASAEATLNVFKHMNDLIGVGTNASTSFLNYSTTNYLTSATTLVDADKALDTQIKSINDTIGSMDATNVTVVTVTDTSDVIKIEYNGIDENDGKISANATISSVTFAKVAKTGDAADVTVGTDGITATDVEGALVELKNAITGANITIDGHKGAITTDANTMTHVGADGGSFGVHYSGDYLTADSTNGLHLTKVDTAGSSTTETDLATVKTVKTYISSEIADLDVDPLTLATISANEITIGKVEEVNGKIAVNGTTSIPVDGTVSSENKLVTQNSISSKIEELNVTGYEQGSVSGSEIKIYGIKEDDGKISHDTTKDTTIVLGSNYNATNNKVALQSNITDEINKLDVDTVQAVTYTAANEDNGAKLTFTGIKEEDGKIAVGTGNTYLQFAKVATSGTAADVAIVDSNDKYTATDVEGALYEVKQDIAALAGGMRYNGGIANSTASLNTSTNDIRPGDIYLATGDFTLDGKSVEAGDMIIYKGNQSSSDVTLDSSNCNIIERETDTMVTAGDALTADQVVFGNGNKSVVISTITKTDLLDAMANANSALQSIGTGTDGDFVTTTVSAKENNTQNVSVALTQSTVTYSNGTVTAGNGVLTNSAIAPITDYVDYKVGTIVNSLDKPVTEVTGRNVKVEYEENNGIVTIGTITETYASVADDLTVTEPDGLVKGSDIAAVKTYIGTVTANLDKAQTTTNGTNVHVAYSETDGIVTINSVTEDYATVEVDTTAEPSLTVTYGTKLAVGSDIDKVRQYVDAKISTSINALDANVTSTETTIATVQVVEENGKITGVHVTAQDAQVSYTASVGTTTAANIASGNTNGALTGADIAAIKSYVDDKASQASQTQVSNASATIPVNVGTDPEVILGTVAGVAITAQASFTWEEYE